MEGVSLRKALKNKPVQRRSFSAVPASIAMKLSNFMPPGYASLHQNPPLPFSCNVLPKARCHQLPNEMISLLIILADTLNLDIQDWIITTCMGVTPGGVCVCVRGTHKHGCYSEGGGGGCGGVRGTHATQYSIQWYCIGGGISGIVQPSILQDFAYKNINTFIGSSYPTSCMHIHACIQSMLKQRGRL